MIKRPLHDAMKSIIHLLRCTSLVVHGKGLCQPPGEPLVLQLGGGPSCLLQTSQGVQTRIGIGLDRAQRRWDEMLCQDTCNTKETLHLLVGKNCMDAFSFPPRGVTETSAYRLNNIICISSNFNSGKHAWECKLFKCLIINQCLYIPVRPHTFLATNVELTSS